MDLGKLDKWHHTGKGNLVFGLLELAIGYGFASWAINTGSLWQYVLAILFLFGGAKNLFAAARHLFHR